MAKAAHAHRRKFLLHECKGAVRTEAVLVD